MDLGTKNDKSETTAAQSPSADMPDVSYPSFVLTGEAAEKFMEEHDDLEVGDEFTITMRLKLAGLHDSEAKYESGKRVELEACSMGDDGGNEPSDAHEKDEDEDPQEGHDAMTGNPAVDRMMRKKRKGY